MKRTPKPGEIWIESWYDAEDPHDPSKNQWFYGQVQVLRVDTQYVYFTLLMRCPGGEPGTHAMMGLETFLRHYEVNAPGRSQHVALALAAQFRSDGEYWDGTPEHAAFQRCADRILEAFGLTQDDLDAYEVDRRETYADWGNIRIDRGMPLELMDPATRGTFLRAFEENLAKERGEAKVEPEPG